ncbi:unnamed protein product [Fusarium equiseti]|uniref:F-box domain-containing protein n=1 Tax=Fusarium equiseti TaxID=61235 RepID=A0A8J2NEA6_FUSEQ|nr:unnamed protein product [Fusarium equiseti]
MESFPPFEMYPSDSNPKLLTLPNEIIFNIMTLTGNFQSKTNLAQACSSLYDRLIITIYKQASKAKSKHANAHIYEACRDGNIRTLERSLQAESISHLDIRIQERLNRPLYTAIQFYQVEVVEWLLARGADPNYAALLSLHKHRQCSHHQTRGTGEPILSIPGFSLLSNLLAKVLDSSGPAGEALYGDDTRRLPNGLPLRGFGSTYDDGMSIKFNLEAQYGGVLLEYIAASSEIGGLTAILALAGPALKGMAYIPKYQQTRSRPGILYCLVLHRGPIALSTGRQIEIGIYDMSDGGHDTASLFVRRLFGRELSSLTRLQSISILR